MLIPKKAATSAPAVPPAPRPAAVPPPAAPPAPVVTAPPPPVPPPPPAPAAEVVVPAAPQPARASLPVQRVATEIAMPDYIPKVADGEIAPGMENVIGETASLPMLTIAQSNSPQVQELHIMQAGDCYVTTERDVKLFGVGDMVEFVPIHYYKEWVAWNHRSLGGGMVGRDMNPRGEYARLAQQQLRDRAKYQGQPSAQQQPISYVETLNWLAMFTSVDAEGNPQYTPLVIPFSKSKYKKGKLLITFSQKRSSYALYATKYSITPVFEKNKKGDGYYNFDVQPSGFPSKEEYVAAEQAYKEFSQLLDARMLQVKYEQEHAPDDVEVIPGGAEAKKDY